MKARKQHAKASTALPSSYISYHHLRSSHVTCQINNSVAQHRSNVGINKNQQGAGFTGELSYSQPIHKNTSEYR